MSDIVAWVIVIGWLYFWVNGSIQYARRPTPRQMRAKLRREQTPEMVAEYRARREALARRAEELNNERF